MGFDLYREHDNKEPFTSKSEADYFRWNIWGFPPIRFLGELYGWIPMGTIAHSWTDDEGTEYPEKKCGYDTNDGQTVCEEDANNWAKALKAAVKDLKIIKHNKSSGKLDDEFFKEREKIWDMDAEAIKNWFSTKDDIEYVKEFIEFLEKGEFRIY